jgi:hypothetical protein
MEGEIRERETLIKRAVDVGSIETVARIHLITRHRIGERH